MSGTKETSLRCWRDDMSQVILGVDSTVVDAVSALEKSGVQITLVVDEDGRLIGTVTDGDIRRALLRGGSLGLPIAQVMCKEFCSLNESVTEAEVLGLMLRKKLHQIPVVDGAFRPVHLFLLEDFFARREVPNPVVIMAGGEGKRLRPLTEDCPKPMLKVAGKPMLESVLQSCIDEGFQNFYFAVNYLKNHIKNYFGDGASWGVNIKYLEENQPLGTAGALGLLPKYLSDPVLVLNGDVLTRVNYANLLRFHKTHNADATLCVREHSTQIPYGVVQMDGIGVLGVDEKPTLNHYVNAGVYLINPALINLLPANRFFDMPELLEKAISSKKEVNAFPIHEYWIDVGSHETFGRVHKEWG